MPLRAAAHGGGRGALRQAGGGPRRRHAQGAQQARDVQLSRAPRSLSGLPIARLLRVAWGGGWGLFLQGEVVWRRFVWALEMCATGCRSGCRAVSMLEQCITRLARFLPQNGSRPSTFRRSRLSTNQMTTPWSLTANAERFHPPSWAEFISSAGTNRDVSNGPASVPVSALPPPRAADHVGSGRDGAGGTRPTSTLVHRA